MTASGAPTRNSFYVFSCARFLFADHNSFCPSVKQSEEEEDEEKKLTVRFFEVEAYKMMILKYTVDSLFFTGAEGEKQL